MNTLSASLDGITMVGDVIWECKQWNTDKARDVEAGLVPACDYWQVVQQLHITGAEKCLYMVTDGTEEGTRYLWVQNDEHLAPDIQALLAGWKQFQKDLEAYEPIEAEQQASGARPESLPALDIRVEGKVLATNLQAFREHAIAVFDGISTDLQTDQDFADAEAAVKWCSEVEGKLKAAKEAALAQTADIDALFKAIDDISESARRKRLDLDKLVKARKEARKGEIQEQAVQALREHYASINDSLSHGIELGVPVAFRQDVGHAMKGKRTIQSLMDAAHQALTDAKLEANAEADRIRANLQAFPELAAGYETLFADIRVLAGKAPDDFAAVIKLRISEHEAELVRRAEQKRIAAEQEELRNLQERTVKEPAKAAARDPIKAATRHYTVHMTVMIEAGSKDEARVIARSRAPGTIVAVDVQDEAA